MTPQRSEADYIVNDIIPQFEELNYPPAGNSGRVKVNTVPIYRPSGGRSGSTIDLVYFHNREPLLLVEAKRRNRTHEEALIEAKRYMLNFPVEDEDFAPSGRRPDYVTTTVGREIKFHKHWFEIENNQPVQHTKEVDTLTFDELISEAGLKPEFRSKKLSVEDFRENFLNEFLAIFAVDTDLGITPDVIKDISRLILSYLNYPDNYTNHQPYTDFSQDRHRQRHIRDLFRRFDLVGSLSKEIAFEYRDFILRSFQGSNLLNQYLTPQSVIAFMINLCEVDTGDKVLDFECGSGSYIASAVHQGVGLENVLGIDINELPYYVAKTYIALYFGITGEDIDDIPIKNDNGLLFWNNDWNVVIGNPAGGGRYDSEGELDDIEQVLENLEADLDNNGKPDSFSEYNFSIQQAVRSCKVRGKICLVLPESFFANPSDEILRKYVSKYCKVKSIISLPRGVFRKGTTTRTVSTGNISSNQKMSILFAEKIKEVEDKSGVDIDLEEQKYPIFLASIEKPDNAGSDIDAWLEPLLAGVLKEWDSWKSKQILLDENEAFELPTKKVFKTSKNIQQKLIKPEEPLFSSLRVKAEKPKSSKKTVIPDILESLFKK